MALNTNGWDYIYTINIDKMNTLISNHKNSEKYKVLDIDKITGKDSNDNSFTFVTAINSFKILNSSNYNMLEVQFDLKSTISYKNSTPADVTSKEYSNLLINLKINIDWLNRKTTTITNEDIVVTLASSISISDDKTAITRIYSSYFNEKFIQLAGTKYNIANAVPRNYQKYYDFFASLNTFNIQTGCEWMIPTTQRFSVKSNVHKYITPVVVPTVGNSITQSDVDKANEINLNASTNNPKNVFFSFSCMIDNHPNNDPGYVDLNAIPEGASSALVIDRKHLLEYMIMPSIKNLFLVNNILKETKLNSWEAYKSTLKIADFSTVTNFNKNSTYSFVNNEELYLLSIDYKKQNGDWQNGKVEAKKNYITIEEDKLRLTLTDVEYIYQDSNNKYAGAIKAQVSKEYVVYFSKDTSSKLSTVVNEVYYTVNPVYPETIEPEFETAFKEVYNGDYVWWKVGQEYLLPSLDYVIEYLFERNNLRKHSKVGNSNSFVAEQSFDESRVSLSPRKDSQDNSLGIVQKYYPQYYNKISREVFIEKFSKILQKYLDHIKLWGNVEIRKTNLNAILELIKDESIIKNIIEGEDINKDRKINNVSISNIELKVNAFQFIIHFTVETEKTKKSTYKFTYDDTSVELEIHINEDVAEKKSDTDKFNCLSFNIMTKFEILENILSKISCEFSEIEKINNDEIDKIKKRIESYKTNLKPLNENEIRKIIHELEILNRKDKISNICYTGYNVLKFIFSPVIGLAIENSLSAYSYQASIKEANNQIKLDTAIKENRVVVKEDNKTKKDMLIAENIKLLMNSIVLPGATNTSTFHTIELNNAFRISYT